MQETWVRSLGWGDLLEVEKATHSSILARTHRVTFTLERSRIWDWNMPAKMETLCFKMFHWEQDWDPLWSSWKGIGRGLIALYLFYNWDWHCFEHECVQPGGGLVGGQDSGATGPGTPPASGHSLINISQTPQSKYQVALNQGDKSISTLNECWKWNGLS